MKKICTFITALLITATCFAQPTETKLSDHFKVTFPGPPEVTPGGNGAMIYTYGKKDSSAGYMALSLDLAPLGLTLEMVNAMGDQLFEQMKAPMVAQVKGATLTKSELTTFKGRKSMFIEMSIVDPPGTMPKKAYIYIFFTGAQLNAVNYSTSATNATVASGKDFFDSAVIID